MSNKKYWKGFEELQETPEFVKLKENEFAEELPMDEMLGSESIADSKTNRRDFLKFLGFSVTAASLAACETPVNRAIPYLNKPEEITPGVANYYASTYWDGNDFAGVLVKTREGRPIKVDGNDLCPITKGGSHARVQASVLSLYDSERLTGPLANGEATTWDELDSKVIEQLNEIAAAGGNIRILSSTVISPSLKKAITAFSNLYPNTKHVAYDAISHSGMIEANQESFGKAIIPTYDFSKADMVVGFNCDFLANWLSPVEHARQYAEKRKIDPEQKRMSRHVQVESLLSVTGSNADERIALKPSQIGSALVQLYNKLTGSSLAAKSLGEKDSRIGKLANELNNYKGKALVVCGSNDKNIQLIVNAINSYLGSYASAINLNVADKTRQGIDKEVVALQTEIEAGSVQALFVLNSNPVYTLPNSEKLKEALSKIKLTVALSDRADETASGLKFVAPDHHYLESWTDAEPRTGHYTLGQPTISPLFNTRNAIESFLAWTNNKMDAYDYIRSNWETEITGLNLFGGFDKALHNGNYSSEASNTAAIATTASGDLTSAANTINQAAGKAAGLELVIYQKTGLGNGNQANNPWLQELPDPISKVTWDNYLVMNPVEAKKQGFNIILGQEEKSDVVTVTVGSTTFNAPVIAQPGVPEGVIGVAMGYGRTHAGKTANNIGFKGEGINAFRNIQFIDGNFKYEVAGANISESIGKYSIASTQTHHTMMGRNIVKNATLEEYKANNKAGNEDVLLATNLTSVGKDGKATPKELSLWQEFENKNHFWNMSIDLNACIGCGACVIGCNAENNVPVVGKDEVRRSREMHWMRIDRYYSSDMTHERAEEEGVGGIKKFADMEVPSDTDNLEVYFQPLMCQHCNHAPCETVCPVLATTHSLEGLNQMTYNRCIGTRYCANNCPYKVRRFNWFRYNNNPEFDFNMYDDLGKMVLNPDVTVRSRGVMEKCSMCVQRIQAGKLEAKKNSSRPVDGAIKTACQQACPTNAITFGDFNDDKSEVRKAWKNERKYQLLEEIGVQPSVFYLTKIKNTSSTKA
jgi:MoCo/4Fe-4S cofactor protein with predicted Tat translocation signal